MSSDQASINGRALLAAEREQLVAQLVELGFGNEGDTGLSLDANFADSSQVTAERGETDVLVGELRNSLRDVEDAIARVESGTYGICERCGKQVEEARLEAIPSTRYCIADASRAR